MDMCDPGTPRKPSRTAALFAEQVRVARARRRWSQLEVAKRASTTPDRVGEIERGVLDPRLSTVDRVAEVLGLTITVTEAA